MNCGSTVLAFTLRRVSVDKATLQQLGLIFLVDEYMAMTRALTTQEVVLRP
jgi:hypothetical protein